MAAKSKACRRWSADGRWDLFVERVPLPYGRRAGRPGRILIGDRSRWAIRRGGREPVLDNEVSVGDRCQLQYYLWLEHARFLPRAWFQRVLARRTCVFLPGASADGKHSG